MTGIGIDLAEIGRFRTILRSRKTRFISNTFTPLEQEYCRSYRDPSPHFAGTFAAKEALRKISSEYHLPLKDIEIRRTRSGAPEVWLRGRRAKSLYISITHGTRDAFAVAFRK
jgi:holo-[acyl-carrier protein] synthase